jgi:cytoskeletal protein CcmA (bactofilin family)
LSIVPEASPVSLPASASLDCQFRMALVADPVSQRKREVRGCGNHINKEETPGLRPATVANPKEVRTVETPKAMNEARAEGAHIGKSVLVKGELSGSEDLYLDGEVEGSVDLRGHNLTIGPNGRVKAHTQARDVVIQGKVDGNVTADRVELKKSAIHVGNIVTQRIIIEDGAYFKGSVDIQREQKPEPKPEVKMEPKPATASAVAGSSGSTTSASAPAAQGSLVEPKR